MIHQFEEHRQDRFRKFFNDVIAGGREALTPRAVLVINSIGVWGVDLAALHLAWNAGLEFGLIAVYMTLGNAVLHIIMAVALRCYNPGLLTAILLFLPLGMWALAIVSAASGATWRDHVVAVGIVLVIHGGIVAWVRHRLRQLRG